MMKNSPPLQTLNDSKKIYFGQLCLVFIIYCSLLCIHRLKGIKIWDKTIRTLLRVILTSEMYRITSAAVVETVAAKVVILLNAVAAVSVTASKAIYIKDA
ncbi:hypothetical protein [Marinilabilia rubra]|nr:hypothetical protein [Marinilabilia rubra]